MFTARSTVLVGQLTVLLALAARAHGESPASPIGATEIYPPERHKSFLVTFVIQDDAKADVVRRSLAELSTKEANCSIAYGPVGSESRPNRDFLVVEAPATLDPKDVLRALKKGAPTAELLAWTCFQSDDKNLGRGLGAGVPGFAPRDFVLGISSELRWVEAQGGFVEFFFAPGKLSADFLADRFHKLAQPFGVKDVGHVVLESFTWTLADALDPAAAKRAEKSIAKLEGVTAARVDPTAKTLKVDVALQGLRVSGPGHAMPGTRSSIDTQDPRSSDKSREVPRMLFDTNPVLDCLDKEKIALAPRAAPAAKPDEKPPKGG